MFDVQQKTIPYISKMARYFYFIVFFCCKYNCLSQLCYHLYDNIKQRRNKNRKEIQNKKFIKTNNQKKNRESKFLVAFAQPRRTE